MTLVEIIPEALETITLALVSTEKEPKKSLNEFCSTCPFFFSDSRYLLFLTKSSRHVSLSLTNVSKPSRILSYTQKSNKSANVW